MAEVELMLEELSARDTRMAELEARMESRIRELEEFEADAKKRMADFSQVPTAQEEHPDSFSQAYAALACLTENSVRVLQEL